MASSSPPPLGAVPVMLQRGAALPQLPQPETASAVAPPAIVAVACANHASRRLRSSLCTQPGRTIRQHLCHPPRLGTGPIQFTNGKWARGTKGEKPFSYSPRFGIDSRLLFESKERNHEASHTGLDRRGVRRLDEGERQGGCGRARRRDEEGGPRLSLVPAADRQEVWPTDLLPPAGAPSPDGTPEPPVAAMPFDGVALEDSRKRQAGWSVERQRLFLRNLRRDRLGASRQRRRAVDGALGLRASGPVAGLRRGLGHGGPARGRAALRPCLRPRDPRPHRAGLARRRRWSRRKGCRATGC